MLEEDFKHHQEDYLSAKRALNNGLQKLLSEEPDFTKETLNIVHTECSDFFSKFETFLTSISSEGNVLSKTQIKDILSSIENILETSIVYWDTIKNISDKVLITTIKPQKNFLKTSQSILRTHNKKKAKSIQKKFQAHNMPIEGFKSKEKYKLTSTKIEWTSLILGISFLIVSGVIVFLDTINTGMQYWLTRIFISIGVALVITGIFKKSIQARVQIPGLAITAAGGFAVFFILYFFNPAEAPEYQKNGSYSNSNNSTNIKIEKDNIVQSGRNNTINIHIQKDNEMKIESLFLTEKKLNLPLLKMLADKESDSTFDLQKFSYDPTYLNIQFLESKSLYQNISNDKILYKLSELLSILQDVNLKIHKLHSANNKMLSGNFQAIQIAVVDFHSIDKSAKKAISIYEDIEQLLTHK